MQRRRVQTGYTRKRQEEAAAFANSSSSSVSEELGGVISLKADKATEITAGEGLTGGGDLSDSRTLSLDVDSLTEDASPVGAEDYVPTWDGSASEHKKVLLSALLGAGASELNDLDDVEITSPTHNDVLVFVDAIFDFALSGDMNSGGDQLLFSGDEQAGTDVILISGDDSVVPGVWKNIPFSSLPLA